MSSPFHKLISKYFGFPEEEPVWPWGNAGRVVENHELPPPRQPLVPEHQRHELPPGLSDPTGWREVRLEQQKQQRSPKNEMRDFLHDGAIFPKKKDK